MPSRLPTIVLVHGAWSAPAMFRKLVTQLQDNGFTVHVPDLPSSSGSRPPSGSLEEDSQVVRSVVQSHVDNGEHVVMLMHSYGGAVGSNAVHGLTAPARMAANKPGSGGVTCMVFLAGYMLEEQWSVMTVVEKSGMLPLLQENVVVESDGSCLLADCVEGMYHDLSPEDQEEQTGLVRSWNIAACQSAVTHATWKEVPVFYVRTTLDRCVPPVYQDIMLEQAQQHVAAGGKINVSVYDCGHSIYARFPEECVKIVELAVQEKSA